MLKMELKGPIKITVVTILGSNYNLFIHETLLVLVHRPI